MGHVQLDGFGSGFEIIETIFINLICVNLRANQPLPPPPQNQEANKSPYGWVFKGIGYYC